MKVLRYACSMRRARVTYKGAFHHALNRGYDGKAIFSKSEEKELFLELLSKNAKLKMGRKK